MNPLKHIFILVTLLVTLAFTVVTKESTSVVITPSSKLVINGKTNINSFTCEFNVLKLKNPIPIFYKKGANNMLFENTVLVLDNNCFDCGGKEINNDFQKLLKSHQFPQIHIKLHEITTALNNKDSLFARFDISIAGVTKSCTIPVELKQKEALFIKGLINLNISDFNLQPPKKVLGLIVVKDAIEINFQLQVKEY